MARKQQDLGVAPGGRGGLGEEGGGAGLGQGPDTGLGTSPSSETLGTTAGGPTLGGPGDSLPAYLQDQQTQQWMDKAAKAKAKPATHETFAGDISSALHSYVDAMANLGPEYGREMEYLKPYLNPGAQTFSSLLNTAALQASPTGNTAVTQAGQQLAQAAQSEPTPGFGHVTDMLKQYTQNLPAQGPLEAALAYQKSLQTYGGMPPNQQGWSPQEKAAYQAITGTQQSTGGVGVSPVTAAAQGNANTLLSLSGLSQSGSSTAGSAG